MADMEEIEAKILKAVEDAQRSVSRLMLALRPLASEVKRGVIDGDLALKLYKRAKASLGRFGPVIKLRSHAVFARLSPGLQGQIDWIHGLMTELLGLKERLDKARHAAKLYVHRKWRIHLKIAREAMRAAPQVPPKFRALIKSAEKARDDFADADLVPHVPMSLLLLELCETIARGLKRRPRMSAKA